MSYKSQWMGWVLCAALCQVGLSGCDDSNDNAGPQEVSSAGRTSSSSKGGNAGKGGSSGAAGKGGDTGSTASGVSSEGKGGSGGSSAGKSGSAGKGGSDGAAKGGSGGSGTSAPQDCKDQGPKDCLCEQPKSDEQFLNHCSAATCSPFDNKKLSKLKADGTLPPLP